MMKNNRILFVIPSMQQGGAERVVAVMANFWALKNYDVSIFTFDNQQPAYTLNAKVKHTSSLLSSKKRLYAFNSVLNNISRARHYFKLVKTNQYDVIISFTRNASLYCLVYNFFSKKKLIISERTNPRMPMFSRTINSFSHFLYQYADAIVVQTEEALRIYEEMKITLPQNKLVIRNPLEKSTVGHYDPLAKKNIVLAVGRLLNKDKQFDELINLFNNTNNEDWQLHIAGQGPDFDSLQAQIVALKLEHKVFLLGSVQQLVPLYQVAKIFALSSAYEGFPNALCEAMANGCACISYNCATGPAEIIEDNVNGLLIAPGNKAAYSKALSNLMQDEAKIQQFSEEALKIKADLAENLILEKWEKLIYEISPAAN